jgi:signal transduction histidine kinase
VHGFSPDRSSVTMRQPKAGGPDRTAAADWTADVATGSKEAATHLAEPTGRVLPGARPPGMVHADRRAGGGAVTSGVRRAHETATAMMLAEAGRVFSASLDMDATVHSIGELVVGWFADWCVVDLFSIDGGYERVHVSVADATDSDTAEALLAFRLDPLRPSLVAEALQTRKPALVAKVTDRHLQEVAQSPKHLELLRRLGASSYMAVPLLAGDELLGALLIARKQGALGRDELRAAEEIAGLAALALVNARSYTLAKRALHVRDSRLAVVAHDLRNPISNVLFAAGLLELRLRQAGIEGLDSIVNSILSAADSMRRMVDDLMDTASLEEGRLSIHPEVVSAPAIVADALHAHESAAQAAGVMLSARVATAGDVRADPHRIQQVFANLVSNALKFTEPGGSVVITAELLEEKMRFAVSDTGLGIPEDVLHHVFDPFWRGEGQSGRGLGIGLTIAREIVELHGGSISVRSRVGEGSTFSFTLPRTEKEEFA